MYIIQEKIHNKNNFGTGLLITWWIESEFSIHQLYYCQYNCHAYYQINVKSKQYLKYSRDSITSYFAIKKMMSTLLARLAYWGDNAPETL